jgi:hypothetical protein
MEDGAAAHLFIKVRLPFSGEIRGFGVGELGGAATIRDQTINRVIEI